MPQQNRVVECMNRTLVEMATMMLGEHRTPRCFWAEAINTACYISIQNFLRSLLNLTPFELIWLQMFILKHGNLDIFVDEEL
jgi:hypothetical protein